MIVLHNDYCPDFKPGKSICYCAQDYIMDLTNQLHSRDLEIARLLTHFKGRKHEKKEKVQEIEAKHVLNAPPPQEQAL